VTEFLKDYKGILISDFYSAYDSLNCIHQKCLVHLIRDMNDDLWKSPFDYVRTDSTSLAPKSSEVPPDKYWQKVCGNRQIWGMGVG
jgi:hypothetical protein